MTERILFFIYRFMLIPFALFFIKNFKFLMPNKIREMVKDRESNHWPEINSSPIWIHAASGEIEYAKPVIRLLKEKWPQKNILVTYTSPSAKRLIKSVSGIDYAIPLPWDHRKIIQSFINHFNPTICLFARTDVWPELSFQLKKKSIPSILFSATFAENSSRKGLFSSILTRFCFDNLSQVYVVSEEDLKEIQILNIKTPVKILGDTRFDQVLHRINHPKELKSHLKIFLNSHSNKTLIAGSTWQEDDKILFSLLPIIKELNLKLIWVPHEVDQKIIEEAEKVFSLNNFTTARYSSYQNNYFDVLIVDQIGILPELYLLSDFAFIGGSFKEKVHSVMEAIACGLPVILGPMYKNNREAILFNKFELVEKFESPKIFMVNIVFNSEEFKQKLIGLNKIDLIQSKQQIKDKVNSLAGSSELLIDAIQKIIP